MVLLSFITSIFIGIQDPIIQKFAIRIAGGYISSLTGAEVKIGSLYITPNFTVMLDKFSVKDLKHNDLLYVEKLRVRPSMEDIIHGDIHVGRVELTQAHANLITYEGEEHLNFQFILDAFSSEKKEKSSKVIPILVDRILVKGLDFQFWDQNRESLEKQADKEMDYAHLDLKNINLDLEGLSIIGDSIHGIIHHLAASEVSGLVLSYLESDVTMTSKGITLNQLNMGVNESELHLDLKMTYDGFKDFNDFVNAVTLDATIRPTTLLLSDLGPFSKVMYEMPDLIQFQGKVHGPVKRLDIKKVNLAFGNDTKFQGDLVLQPLSILKKNQKLNIDNLTFSYDDLINFRLPGASSTLPIPESLSAIGVSTAKGYFQGNMNSFSSSLVLSTGIGNLDANLMRNTTDMGYSVIEGSLNANRLDVGKFLKASKVIGTLNLSANIIGRQAKGGDLDLDIEGDISDMTLMGTLINEVALNGNLYKNCFNGNININDDDLDLDFKGSFDFSNTNALKGNFVADINSADLHKLRLIQNDETALLTASITADLKNINKFNDLEGSLSIKDLGYTTSKGYLAMMQFDGSISNDNLMQKRILLDCDFFDFEMAGLMDFTTIGTAFKQFINHYVTIPGWTDELQAFEEREEVADQDFFIHLDLHNPKPLTKFFIPSVSISKNTSLNGTFTSKSHALNLTLRTKSVKISSVKIDNVELKCNSFLNRFRTRLAIDQIILRDSTKNDPNAITLDRFNIQALMMNDTIRTDLGWNNMETLVTNNANTQTTIVPTPTGWKFNINKSDIVINDKSWAINPLNYILLEEDKTVFSNLEFLSEKQSLLIDGALPMNPEDTLLVAFDNFNLSTFDFLLVGNGLDIDGYTFGNVKLSDLTGNRTIFANLDINELGLNGEVYGDAKIHSFWNMPNNSIDIDLGLMNGDRKAISLLGSYYLNKKTDNLDFKVGLDNLKISIIQPFLSDNLSRLQGGLTGNLNVQGSLDKPVLKGSLSLKDGGCKVTMLNTFYTFSPEITLSEKAISLGSFILTDTLGNTARAVGQITHNYLKDFTLDVTLFPNNFLAMATTAEHSSSYYGTAIANGIVEFKGPVKNLDLNVKALTKEGTKFTLPLGGSSTVKKQDFITFIEKEEEVATEDDEVVVIKRKVKEKNNINIGLNLDVNDDALIKISLPNNLGSLEAKGNGNIKFDLATSTFAMSLVGDYQISAGSLNLNLENIIRRTFSLDPGSRISWTGDPINGIINATGVYQTKATLSSLGLIDSTSNSANSSVKVECLVRLKNKLMNPDISFGLRLPNATEDTKQAVFYAIDTTNQSEVFMQVVSLLVFNSFSYGSTINGMNLITGQLNDFLAQNIQYIDINFNYRPGSDQSNEEVSLALKKQLFNDRLTIETNFGVIIPNSTAYSTSGTNIVGDFNIDFKITKDGRFSAQAFNRSNYNNYYYQYSFYKMAPYTQGIGFSYSKSFDRLRDFFKKKTNFVPNNSRPVIDKPRRRTQNPSQNEPKE